MSVTAPLADDSYAPISQFPVAGRATPFASISRAATPSEVRFVPFCHAAEPLFVNWYGGTPEAFSSGFAVVLFKSGAPAVVWHPLVQACQLAKP